MANVTLPYGGKKINCEIPDKNLMGIIIPETIASKGGLDSHPSICML